MSPTSTCFRITAGGILAFFSGTILLVGNDPPIDSSPVSGMLGLTLPGLAKWLWPAPLLLAVIYTFGRFRVWSNLSIVFMSVLFLVIEIAGPHLGFSHGLEGYFGPVSEVLGIQLWTLTRALWAMWLFLLFNSLVDLSISDPRK